MARVASLDPSQDAHPPSAYAGGRPQAASSSSSGSGDGEGSRVEELKRKLAVLETDKVGPSLSPFLSFFLSFFSVRARPVPPTLAPRCPSPAPLPRPPAHSTPQSELQTQLVELSAALKESEEARRAAQAAQSKAEREAAEVRLVRAELEDSERARKDREQVTMWRFSSFLLFFASSLSLSLSGSGSCVHIYIRRLPAPAT